MKKKIYPALCFFLISFLFITCKDRKQSAFEVFEEVEEFPEPPEVIYGEMKDKRNGKTYKTVQIGDQVWMAENLNYKISRKVSMGGDLFYYDDVYNSYGSYYKWEDACKICPKGWHLPAMSEWDTLGKYVRSYGYYGTDFIDVFKDTTWLKSGSNAFGFSARPGGYVTSAGGFTTNFMALDQRAYFWSSTEKDSNNIHCWAIEMVNHRNKTHAAKHKKYRLNVRCIKD